MIEHQSPISGISAFKDEYVVTAGYDNQVILWDAKRKEAIARGVHDHLANQCQFNRHGTHLLSCSSDYTARLWKLPEMKLVAVFQDHEDDVETAIFHPTLDYIATASRDHKVRVYNTAGTLLQTFLGHESDVLSIEWVGETTDLISSGDDGTIRRWSLESGKEIKKYDLQGVETDTIIISSDGTIYAGNDEGQIVCLLDQGRKIYDAHLSGIKKLVYSKVHRLVASISYDRKVKIWHIQQNGTLILANESTIPWMIWARSASFQGSSNLVFGTFGSSYATYSFTNEEWDLTNVNATRGINFVSKFQGKYVYVGDSGEIFVENQKISQVPSLLNFIMGIDDVLVCGGQSGTLYNALYGQVIFQFKSPLNCIEKIPGGFVVGTYTGEILVFKKTALGITHKKTIKAHKNAIKSLSAIDGKVFSVCATGDALVYDIHSGRVGKFIPKAHDKIANGCSKVARRYFVSVSRDLTMRLWDKEGNLERVVQSPHDHSIKCVSGSGVNPYVAACSYDGKAAIYNVQSESWVYVKKVTSSGISSVFFDVDRDAFICSSYDGKYYAIKLDEVRKHESI